MKPCPGFAIWRHWSIQARLRRHSPKRLYNPPVRAASSFLSDQVTKPEEIAPAIDAAKASGATALNVLASALLFNNRKIIFERVATWRLPAIYQWPEMAEGEGLLGYGPRIVQIYRDLVSRQVVKILRGIKPADIPVEQPTRFELVINLKAAQRFDTKSRPGWCCEPTN